MIDHSRHQKGSLMKHRFRGFLPVVVDVETSGIDPAIHGLLEVSMVFLDFNEWDELVPFEVVSEHILPFDGAVMDEKSLQFNQIDPYQPLRYAVDEKRAMVHFFSAIDRVLKKTDCQRAVLVGHNAWFDLLFIKEAAKRHDLKLPFHAFTCFDTATLAALIFGQTVLAKALKSAEIPFDLREAHSAIYDAEKTAALFCKMINLWKTAFQAQ